MIYLMWGLINIGLLLYFIFICFRATRLIREKLGLFASLIFVFGLLSFIGSCNNNHHKLNPNNAGTWQFNSEDNSIDNSTNGVDVDLEKTLISKYSLAIVYGEDKKTKLNFPIKAYSTTNGFISGTKWLPISINVNKTDDNKKFQFLVQGIIEWKLLGTTLYSQAKLYRGFAQIK